MENLRLYRIRDDYIAALHKVDNRVQYNKNAKRPYVGIVLTVCGNDYFVPMESPKPNHANIKPGIHIMKLDEGKYWLLGFNNMLPAKHCHLIEFDIDSEPDANYKELLKNQLRYCRNNSNRIRDHAEKTYKAVVTKKSPFYVKICCDFVSLEKESNK